MSGIAEVFLNSGYKITGSDLCENKISRRLSKLGAKIYKGHNAININNQNLCVYSSAIPSSNVEILECKKRNIELISRGEILAEMLKLKDAIAIAGSHGKTTITSMIGNILLGANLDPTILLGGTLSTFKSGAKLGKGKYFVAEMDESDGSFLKVFPIISVISSIDREHINHYGSMDALKNAFKTFANQTKNDGVIIYCKDENNVEDVMLSTQKRKVLYGLSKQADVRATEINFKAFNTSFNLYINEKNWGRINLPLPGTYNIKNALAAWAVARELEIDHEIIKYTLESFESPERRFQLRGEFGDLVVIEDYAHHPTAIKQVLKTAKKGFSKKIIAVFQPHRFTRVKESFNEFISCFDEADIILITDIYASSEDVIPNITGKSLADEISRNGHPNAIYIPEIKSISRKILKLITGNELIIFLGAGDICNEIDHFIALLKKQNIQDGQC